MFDPTAFDNLKIAMEGTTYDRDLNGEILVIDRNDMINLAKLERSYSLTFIEQNLKGRRIEALWSLNAKLENLAAEILPKENSEKQSGCHVTVKFVCVHPNEASFYRNIQKLMEEIWGSERTIDQEIQMNPLDESVNITNQIYIHFNRLVYEEQFEDLTLMLDYMIKSIKELRKLFIS